MKKIATLILAAILLLSITVASYAEVGGNSTVIEYTVYDTYEFTIPPQVSINNEDPLSIAITNKKTVDPLNISLTSKSYTDTGHFMLIHEMNPNFEIEYQLTYGDYAITNGVPFATFSANGTADIYLSVISTGPVIAGRYTDTITFHFG